MTWLKFHLSKNYLFAKIPPREEFLLILFGILSVLLIIFSIFAYKYFKDEKKPYLKVLREKVAVNCSIIGILGLILVFVGWQEIPYFSAPILILILMLVFFAIILYNIFYYQKNIKPQINKFKLEQNYQKYLPKNN